MLTMFIVEDLEWVRVEKKMQKTWLYAILCRSGNFKPIFDKVKDNQKKNYVGESYRTLNSLFNKLNWRSDAKIESHNYFTKMLQSGSSHRT